MKSITIVKEDRTVTYNPMFVKCVELVHYKNQETWHVNVVHVIEGREVPETVICKDRQSAIELHKEYQSCLESIFPNNR